MPRQLESCSMPATAGGRGNCGVASCFWPSACLCWSLSTSIRVEISPQLSADSFPGPGVEIDVAIHLDALDRYRKTKGPFRGLPDRRDCGDRRHAGLMPDESADAVTHLLYVFLYLSLARGSGSISPQGR